MSDLNPKINLIDRLMVKAHRKQIPPFQGMPHEKNKNKTSNKQFTKKQKQKKQKNTQKKFLNSVIDGEPYDGKLSRTVRGKVYLLVTGTYI